MTTSRPSAADLDITIPELGEPTYGGQSAVFGEPGSGQVRWATFTRLPVTNNVEVTLHGDPHRIDFLQLDNETGAVAVYFVRQTKGANRRDYKLANRWVDEGLEGLRRSRVAAHRAIANAVDAALAPLRVEDEPAPADEFPANGDMMVVAGPIPAAMADRGVVPGQRVMVTEVDKTTPTVWVTGMAEDGVELDYRPSELTPATEPVHCPNHGPVEYLCCQPKAEAEEYAGRYVDGLGAPTGAPIPAEDQGGFDYTLPNGEVVRAYDVFAIAVDAGQRVLAMDGVGTLLDSQHAWLSDKPGMLVESTRTDNQGYVHLTVWGALRMFEIVLESNTQVRVTRS